MSDAKGVEISGLDLPNSLDPGDNATARITFKNKANWISPWDDDRCSASNVGLLVEGVLIGPNGEEHVGDTVCAEQHDIIFSYEGTSRVSFSVPQTEGSHRYEAYVRTAETGEESSRVSQRIDVFHNEEDEPAEAPGGDGSPWPDDWFTDGDGDGDGDNGDGDGFSWPWESDGSDIFDKIDTLILVIVMLAAMYAAGQLFDIQIGGD